MHIVQGKASVIDRTASSNRLFAAMDDASFAALSGHLTEVKLPAGKTLIQPDTPVPYAWFLEDGICSVIAVAPNGMQAEVGLIGRDGVVDTSAIHGTDRTPLLCMMQIEGHGYRIRTEALRRISDDHETLRQVLLAFAQSFFIQVAHTALSNASHTIAQRLARWLLMSHDRLGVLEMRLTHEQLSLMLGVRRAGVTLAIQTLERSGLVQAHRGRLTVLDRAALETFAASNYGAPEAEYQRLLRVSLA